MASLNDFKILNKKCEKYFELLIDSTKINQSVTDDIEKRRLGFYILILEQLFPELNIEDYVSMVTDTEFNNIVEGEKFDDYGVDAVCIDEQNKKINLFNFKFRTKFKDDASQSLNDPFVSTKFLNAIYQENLGDLAGKPRSHAKKIIEKFQQNEAWTLTLFQVSNEVKQVLMAGDHISNLVEMYDMKLESIALPEISQMISNRPEPISASLVLDKDAVMSYSENSYDSAKSYIARIASNEIIRITSNSAELRHNSNLEDISVLAKSNIDIGVLFDNVRGFVIKSKFNPNIFSALKETPSKFFMYNNGITIVAQDIKAKSINGDKKLSLNIKNFQILNGGQTLRTIHNFNKVSETNITKYLSKSEVLVRVFMADTESNEVNKIAEFTNSQNAISALDLKSLSSEQIDLEKYLAEHNIVYSRKSGDTGSDDKDYEHQISMKSFGQILQARSGHPEKSTNSIQKIFRDEYERLFKNFDISIAPKIVKDYYQVIDMYKKSEYKGIMLRYMYIMYMKTLCESTKDTDLIELFEEHLQSYTTEKETSDVRKMGQIAFKEQLKEKLLKTASSL